jgi:hypothetical protein
MGGVGRVRRIGRVGGITTTTTTTTTTATATTFTPAPFIEAYRGKCSVFPLLHYVIEKSLKFDREDCQNRLGNEDLSIRLFGKTGIYV